MNFMTIRANKTGAKGVKEVLDIAKKLCDVFGKEGASPAPSAKVLKNQQAVEILAGQLAGRSPKVVEQKMPSTPTSADTTNATENNAPEKNNDVSSTQNKPFR
jgi:hypothetical protein